MEERFWAMFTEIAHKERYYWHYQIRAQRIDAVLTGLCLITSASSIAGWSLWLDAPLLWGGLICISQIVQVLKPLYPFARQLTSTKFLLPQLRKLLTDIEHSWDSINAFDATSTADLLHKYQRHYDALTSQFCGDTYFPVVSSCESNAQKDCEAYFSHNFNVTANV